MSGQSYTYEDRVQVSQLHEMPIVKSIFENLKNIVSQTITLDSTSIEQFTNVDSKLSKIATLDYWENEYIFNGDTEINITQWLINGDELGLELIAIKYETYYIHYEVCACIYQPNNKSNYLFIANVQCHPYVDFVWDNNWINYTNSHGETQLSYDDIYVDNMNITQLFTKVIDTGFELITRVCMEPELDDDV